MNLLKLFPILLSFAFFSCNDAIVEPTLPESYILSDLYPQDTLALSPGCLVQIDYDNGELNTAFSFCKLSCNPTCSSCDHAYSEDPEQNASLYRFLNSLYSSLDEARGVSKKQGDYGPTFVLEMDDYLLEIPADQTRKNVDLGLGGCLGDINAHFLHDGIVFSNPAVVTKEMIDSLYQNLYVKLENTIIELTSQQQLQTDLVPIVGYTQEQLLAMINANQHRLQGRTHHGDGSTHNDDVTYDLVVDDKVVCTLKLFAKPPKGADDKIHACYLSSPTLSSIHLYRNGIREDLREVLDGLYSIE